MEEDEPEEGKVEEEEPEETKEEEGIECLPGDKKGLIDRLLLLLAEREAGNTTSNTEEIVGTLDLQLRMSIINHKQI